MSSDTHSAATVSVVIPAYQAAGHLARCLHALALSSVAPLETFVVDDGSTDGTRAVAAAYQVQVLVVGSGPRGPAVARNLGAARALGDVVLFLDADVAVHPDTVGRLARCLETHADVAAVFGSYDDRPSATSTVSQYRNLLHHFVHQHGAREATTFWAGCGAIRRSTFTAAGGFDERFARPSIEDIELGGRLRDLGYRVWLCPDIQATHLKGWTLTSMIRSDVVDRASPWTKLIVERARVPRDLNTSLDSRLSAAAAWIMLGACGVAAFDARAFWVTASAASALLVLNRRLYRFFLDRRGLVFSIAAITLHTLYLLYSSLTFLVVATASRRGVSHA